MNTYRVEKEITIKSPIGDVFSSLTDSKEVVKYFPLTAVESSWKEGEDVLYKGEVEGVPFTDYGVIEKLSSPCRTH